MNDTFLLFYSPKVSEPSMNFNISKMVYSLAPRTREWGDRINEKIDVISRFLRRPVFVKTYKKEKSKEKKIFWRTYHKIPQRSPGIYIFQRPFLRGLHSEGLIYGGKFAFQNRLG